LCIQINTTNYNSVCSLYSLQQDPAEFYGRHRAVNSDFTKVNVYQVEDSPYQAVGAINSIKNYYPK